MRPLRQVRQLQLLRLLQRQPAQRRLHLRPAGMPRQPPPACRCLWKNHSDDQNVQLISFVLSSRPSPAPLNVQPCASGLCIGALPYMQLSLHLPGCLMPGRLALWVRGDWSWLPVAAISGQAWGIYDAQGEAGPHLVPILLKIWALHGNCGKLQQLWPIVAILPCS